MVVAFYFRLHLAYFPRPVVAIFARPEQRQKRKVPPVTNVSLAVFPAESRASKTSALWRTGVTI